LIVSPDHQAFGRGLQIVVVYQDGALCADDENCLRVGIRCFYPAEIGIENGKIVAGIEPNPPAGFLSRLTVDIATVEDDVMRGIIEVGLLVADLHYVRQVSGSALYDLDSD
jgi:hypothetical protein